MENKSLEDCVIQRQLAEIAALKAELEAFRNSPTAEHMLKLERENARLREVMEEIANEDFRGNRSNASVKAFNVLKKLGYRK